MNSQHKLLQSLRRAGLTAYESEVYLALLSNRELTAEEISKVTSVPITRVYGTVEQLTQKGFARIVESRPKRYLAISPGEARQEYVTHLRKSFEGNLLTIEDMLSDLQKRIEPLYYESHLQVKPEQLLEPLSDLKTMERATRDYIQQAEDEVLISTALFSWLPKTKAELKSALRRGVRVRILMQLAEAQAKRQLAGLMQLGAQMRDTSDPWHPVRGTLVDNEDLIFVIWAAEETQRHWNPIVYTPHHTKNPGLIRIFRESFLFRWDNSKRTTFGRGST